MKKDKKIKEKKQQKIKRHHKTGKKEPKLKKLEGFMFHCGKICELIKENISFRGCAIFFFGLAIMLSFFQINAVVIQDIQWGGKFSPYNTFQMYASDMAFALSLLSYGLYVLFNSKRVFFTLGNQHSRTALFGLVFFALVSYFFSVNQTVTFFWLIQLAKLTMIYLMLINRFISDKTLILLILWSLSFQSAVGIVQFIMQSSIGLGFLGESNIGPEVINVAKIQVGDSVIVRPYGTFTHANIFGGLMSLGLILAGYLKETHKIGHRFANFFIAMCGIGTFLSFSRSAWLATLVSTVIYLAFRKYKVKYSKMKKYLIGLLGFIAVSSFTGILSMVVVRLSVINDESIIARLEQIKTSFFMMLGHPFGVGLGNYTNAAADYSSSKLMPWEFEPVHNIFLTIGTELGIIAMIISIIVITKALLELFKKLKGLEGKYKCFPLYFGIIIITHLIILGNLDHYFYTNYSATIFLISILAITTNYLGSREDSEVSLG